jgi:hypothetical protein
MNLPARVILNLLICLAIIALLAACGSSPDEALACRGVAFSINAPAQTQAAR